MRRAGQKLCGVPAKNLRLPGQKRCEYANGKISRTYLVHGKPKGWSRNITVTIGKHGVVSTEWARVEAKRILAMMAQGINPNGEKKEGLKAAFQKAEEAAVIEKLTLSKLLADYMGSRQLKEKTATDYLRFTKRCLGDWLSLPVAEITRDMVQKRHLELSKGHHAQANYTMRILRALFKYAIAVYEDADGKPLITVNPVDRLKHARLWNKNVRRQTLISPHQLKIWYEAVAKLKNTEARDILLLEIFTGLRHGEAISLEWKNVNFNQDILLIEDTKNRSDFMLPMSSWVSSMLRKRFKETGSERYVFPSPAKSGAHIGDIRQSIQEVVSQTGIKFTEHDLRRTFETTAESLEISYYTLKKLLNHKTGADPTAGYIVTSAERMREAAEKVGSSLAKCMGVPQPVSGVNNIAKLRKVE